MSWLTSRSTPSTYSGADDSLTIGKETMSRLIDIVGRYFLNRYILACLLVSTAAASPLPGQSDGQDRVLEAAAPEDVQMSSGQLKKIDRVVKEAIEAGDIPGAVVLVARHSGIVYRRAFGDRALEPQREEMTPDTIFDMASLTKVLATAPSVLALVEDGRISLSDPLARYIPDFGQHDKEGVTIRQLLTHFSGLRPDLDLDEPWSGYDTAIERACAEHLVALPGTRFIYSDINFLMLAELVRVVSGKALDEFSRERIFKPLGMTRTSFKPPAEWIPEIAPTQWRDGEMLRGRVHDPTASRMGGVAGHAGLFSTIDDTAAFAQMLLNGGIYAGRRILSPLTIRQMTSNQSPPGNSAWRGLGLDIRTQFSSNRGDLFPVGSFGHTGFTGTSLWVDPSTDCLVLVFTNRLHPSGGGNVVSLRRRIATVAAAAISDVDLASRAGRRR